MRVSEYIGAQSVLLCTCGNPSRFSTHTENDVNAKFPHMAIFGEALKHADPDWRPIIPVWGKVNADLGTTLSKVLTENIDIQQALDGVAERTEKIMKDAGYWKPLLATLSSILAIIYFAQPCLNIGLVAQDCLSKRHVMTPQTFNRLTPYMFLAPAVIIMAIALFYPLGYMVYGSFRDWNLAKPFMKAPS